MIGRAPSSASFRSISHLRGAHTSSHATSQEIRHRGYWRQRAHRKKAHARGRVSIPTSSRGTPSLCVSCIEAAWSSRRRVSSVGIAASRCLFLQCPRRVGICGNCTFRQKLDPASGRSAVLGRNALSKPGDCATARRSSGKAKPGLGSIALRDGLGALVKEPPSLRKTAIQGAAIRRRVTLATREYDMLEGWSFRERTAPRWPRGESRPLLAVRPEFTCRFQ